MSKSITSAPIVRPIDPRPAYKRPEYDHGKAAYRKTRNKRRNRRRKLLS